MSTNSPATSDPDRAAGPSSRWKTASYQPRHDAWPYTPTDFRRQDESPDTHFYAPMRLVTHIDDNAINTLRTYYGEVLPRRGRVLDLCSSWVSHLPRDLEKTATATAERRRGASATANEDRIDSTGSGGGGAELEVIGVGMNKAELAYNPVLSSYHLLDLNASPSLPASLGLLDSTVCVVSIDYLVHPREVLSSLRDITAPDGSVHLVLSNRCFPTKAIGRWLRVSEDERVKMVGDYLWWSGWREVEMLELVEPPTGMRWMSGGTDPLWVVRGKKIG